MSVAELRKSALVVSILAWLRKSSLAIVILAFVVSMASFWYSYAKVRQVEAALRAERGTLKR
jgi:hypothetical protein